MTYLNPKLRIHRRLQLPQLRQDAIVLLDRCAIVLDISRTLRPSRIDIDSRRSKLLFRCQRSLRLIGLCLENLGGLAVALLNIVIHLLQLVRGFEELRTERTEEKELSREDPPYLPAARPVST